MHGCVYCNQLIDIYGSLLERPLIKQDFDDNYPEVVERMDRDILDCKVIYDKAMEVRAPAIGFVKCSERK